MTMPKVSVIIRAYNPNEWIFEAINSVIKQSYQGIVEIVICYDKASRTVDIFEQLKQLSIQSPRDRIVKIIVHEHMNPARALFECGFRESSGDYVFILDYDNRMPENYIEEVIRQIEGRDFVCTNPMLVNEKGEPLGVRAHKKIPKTINVRSLARGNVCDSNGIVLSRKAVNTLLECYGKYLKHLRITDLVHEDYFIALVCSKIFGVKYINNVYTYYRVHGSQQTYLLKPDVDKMCQILLRDIVTLHLALRVLDDELTFSEKLYVGAMMFKRLMYVMYLSLGTLRSVVSLIVSAVSAFISYLKVLLRRSTS